MAEPEILSHSGKHQQANISEETMYTYFVLYLDGTDQIVRKKEVKSLSMNMNSLVWMSGLKVKLSWTLPQDSLQAEMGSNQELSTGSGSEHTPVLDQGHGQTHWMFKPLDLVGI